MIVKPEAQIYSAKQILKLFDTSISELSDSGKYNLYPYPELILTYPVGGESIVSEPGNNVVRIRWNSERYKDAEKVTIAFSTDDKDYTTIVPKVLNTAQNMYEWSLDDNILNDSSTYRIQLAAGYTSSVNNGTIVKNTVTATSEQFTINFKYVEILPIGPRGQVMFSQGTGSKLEIPFYANHISDYVVVQAKDASRPYVGYVTLNEKYYAIQGNSNSFTVDIDQLYAICKDTTAFEETSTKGFAIQIVISDYVNNRISSTSDVFYISDRAIPPITTGGTGGTGTSGTAGTSGTTGTKTWIYDPPVKYAEFYNWLWDKQVFPAIAQWTNAHGTIKTPPESELTPIIKSLVDSIFADPVQLDSWVMQYEAELGIPITVGSSGTSAQVWATRYPGVPAANFDLWLNQKVVFTKAIELMQKLSSDATAQVELDLWVAFFKLKNPSQAGSTAIPQLWQWPGRHHDTFVSLFKDIDYLSFIDWIINLSDQWSGQSDKANSQTMPNLIRIFNETYPPSSELMGYIQRYRSRTSSGTGEGNPNPTGGGPFS